MRNTTFSRRDVIKGSAAAAGSAIVARAMVSVVPPGEAPTMSLIGRDG